MTAIHHLPDERAARRERINQLERQLIEERHTIERVQHYLNRPSERSQPYSERLARESMRQAIERSTVAELELARLRSIVRRQQEPAA